MATAEVSKGRQQLLDPSKPAKYDVRLGDSLKRQNKADASFTTVTFNHKPSQTCSSRETNVVSPRGANSPFELRIRDQDPEGVSQYKYNGRRKRKEKSYILTLSDDKQYITLDELGARYEFNLVSAPWQKDAAKLSQQYDQVQSDNERQSSPDAGNSSAGEELFGGDTDGSDEENPFDYRHYLSGLPTASADSRVPSTVSTPLHNPMVGSQSGSLQKPAPAARPNGTPSRTNGAPTPSPNHSQSPLVNPGHRDRPMRRSPSASEPEEESGGGLVIDYGDEHPRKKQRQMTPSGGKPISLHAAASAAARASEPGSSPAIRPAQAKDAGVPNSKPSKTKDADAQVNNPKASDSASQSERPPPVRRQSTWDPGDEAALQAALEEALEEQEEEEAQGAAAADGGGKRDAPQSESESEEE